MNEPPRVLIVEDDADALQMLTLLFEGWGFVVDPALTGIAAIACFKGHCPDVVISDLVMPGMNGLELLHAIRQVNTDCVFFFILITGYATVPRGIEAIEAGADEVLLKPIDLTLLRHLLETHGFVHSEDAASPPPDGPRRLET